MRTKEEKTLVISVSDKELEQLALVGIHSIIKTKQISKLDDALYEKAKIYREIRDICCNVPPELSAAVKSLKLNDCNYIKLVLDN